MQMSFWRFDQMREVKIEESVKREKDIITKERKKQKKLGEKTDEKKLTRPKMYYYYLLIIFYKSCREANWATAHDNINVFSNFWEISCSVWQLPTSFLMRMSSDGGLRLPVVMLP